MPSASEGFGRRDQVAVSPAPLQERETESIDEREREVAAGRVRVATAAEPAGDEVAERRDGPDREPARGIDDHLDLGPEPLPDGGRGLGGVPVERRERDPVASPASWTWAIEWSIFPAISFRMSAYRPRPDRPKSGL